MTKPSRGGARAKLRSYFLANIGKKLTSDKLRAASGNISEWARRVRELRDEEGYAILSHRDRDDLKPNEYLLEEAKPRPVFAREISASTRSYVLARNGYTCQQCGAGAGEPHPDNSGRKTRLHIGHIVDKSMGGSDEPGNLRAVCSVCNEGASNQTLDPPSRIKLMTQVRRAAVADQLALLDWLKAKYSKHGS